MSYIVKHYGRFLLDRDDPKLEIVTDPERSYARLAKFSTPEAAHEFVRSTNLPVKGYRVYDLDNLQSAMTMKEQVEALRGLLESLDPGNSLLLLTTANLRLSQIKTALQREIDHIKSMAPVFRGDDAHETYLNKAVRFARKTWKKIRSGEQHASFEAVKALEATSVKFPDLEPFGIEGWSLNSMIGVNYINRGESTTPTIFALSNYDTVLFKVSSLDSLPSNWRESSDKF